MRLVHRYRWVDCVQISLPSGRDGFLATNSLLGFCTLLACEYSIIAGQPPLPRSLAKMIAPHTVAAWKTSARSLWDRDDIVVLYSPLLRAAAVDMESKSTEAALGHVQLADFRHFAHGRHNWLAKRGETSAVLALHSPQDRALAERTLRLVPVEIPRAMLEFGNSQVQAMLTSLVASIILSGERGRHVGIDPGRPGVPWFGSRIYRLAPGPRVITNRAAVWRSRVIERKAGTPMTNLTQNWGTALDQFLHSLSRTTFQGLVVDYDGTLCDSHERFTGLCPEIAAGLNKILSRGVPLGIATGRGKSVRKAMRAVLLKKYWARVLVGYYSGGQIAPLTNASAPRIGDNSQTLAMASRLSQHPAFSELKPEVRFCQLSYAARAGDSLDLLWQELSATLNSYRAAGWRAFRSDHSVDVLASGVSKAAVVSRLRSYFALDSDAAVLCIGDQAREPGNDTELLAEPLALSVGSSSSHLDSGWNLAPPGLRGAGAMMAYFRAISLRGKTFRFVAGSLR
jgi:hypothetical protein